MTPGTGRSCASLMSADVAPISRHTRIQVDWRRQWHRLIAVALIVLGPGLRPVAAQTCVGDCKGEKKVDIGDLITGVNIALGTLPVSACPAFENAQGTVDIAQLIQGVNNALNGCPGAPTATIVTPRSTVTPTRTVQPTPTATRPAGRFVDNGDGTITDTQTGLIWEKKDRGGGLHDYGMTYPWAGQCSDGGAYCQPDAAAATTCNVATGGAIGCAQCAGTATCMTSLGFPTIWDWLGQLNAANFAGHSDWRIPTVAQDGGTAQLETIVDTSPSGCGSGAPCVPPAFNTGCMGGCTVTSCSCTEADFYWSATTLADNPEGAWDVYFYDGDAFNFDGKTFDDYVRAVRGGS